MEDLEEDLGRGRGRRIMEEDLGGGPGRRIVEDLREDL